MQHLIQYGMRVGFRQALVLGFCFYCVCSAVSASPLRVNVAKMPKLAESPNRGVLVDFVRVISKTLAIPVHIRVKPFKRSIADVISGEADLHIPIQKPLYVLKGQAYEFTDAVINHVHFVLYTHKSHPISVEDLYRKKGLDIHTDASMLRFFSFPTQPSFHIEGSLRMVDKGRIQGFLFADSVADPIVKRLSLSNVHRQLFKTYEVVGIVSKGQRGKAADQFLKKGVAALKAKGLYMTYMSAVEFPFDPWQP